MEERNRYERYFSNWLFDVLPDSQSGVVIQDIDFVIQNYEKKKFMIIELKTKGNGMSYPQKAFYNMLHKRLVKTNTDGREYIGTYLITFEGEDFYDGQVFLSGTKQEKIQVDEEVLSDFLYDKLGLYVGT